MLFCYPTVGTYYTTLALRDIRPNPFISDAEAARGCMTERMLSAWQEAVELTSDAELSPYRVLITNCTILRGAIGIIATPLLLLLLLLLSFRSASASASCPSGAVSSRLHRRPNAHKRNQENNLRR